MQSQGPAPYATTRTKYGIYYVGKEKEAYQEFSGLEAEIDYVVYIQLYDRGFSEIEAIGYLDFKTTDRYETAFQDLRFFKTYINREERTNIAAKVAYLLSQNSWKVSELKHQFSFLPSTSKVSSRRIRNRRLGQKKTCRKRTLETTSSSIEDITSYLTQSIIPVPETEINASPLVMAGYLNNSTIKAELLKAYTNFDTSYNVTTTSFVKYEAGFATDPSVLSAGYSNVTFSVKLNNWGWVYAICVKQSEDLGQPSPFQISQGTNYKNIPVPNEIVEISLSYTYYNVTVLNLDADSLYNLYVSTGSAHPGYPDLLNVNSTVLKTFGTQKLAESKFFLFILKKLQFLF